METIRACVSTRLLTKANRLFTGTLEGRIIEILQNARRAGATKVEITNHDGDVSVRDNGEGIDDFSRLLDLGGSGWEEALESSEDPAGVGLFCLTPRQVAIWSNGRIATISGDGWTGEPVEIQDDPETVQGTILRFQDEEWNSAAVDRNAVFSGMDVTVDGKPCPKMPFVSEQASSHPKLGCRIEVRESQDLNAWHNSCKRGSYRTDNVLVNFHGQVVAFDCHPVSEHHLHFLVDMTGEPTGIRMMLPARTRLVEDEAFEELKNALEMEAYRYLERRGQLPHVASTSEFGSCILVKGPSRAIDPTRSVITQAACQGRFEANRLSEPRARSEKDWLYEREAQDVAPPRSHNPIILWPTCHLGAARLTDMAPASVLMAATFRT